MKPIPTQKLSLFGVTLLLTTLAFTACIPMIVDDGTYSMEIFEISNPRVLNDNTAVDVKVVNRGCSPQSLVRADVERTGNNFQIDIRYQDIEGISTCATFEEIHTVGLGNISSGNYVVQARGQATPTLSIIVP